MWNLAWSILLPTRGNLLCLPGVPEAIRLINALGFLAVVISNQPGIAKGKFSVSLLEAMTHQMVSDLAALRVTG